MPHSCVSARSQQHKAYLPWEAVGWGKASDTNPHLALRSSSLRVELEELTTAKQEKLLRQPEEAGWLSLSAAPVRSQICQGAVPSRGIRYAFPCLSRELLALPGLAGWQSRAGSLPKDPSSEPCSGAKTAPGSPRVWEPCPSTAARHGARRMCLS